MLVSVQVRSNRWLAGALHVMCSMSGQYWGLANFQVFFPQFKKQAAAQGSQQQQHEGSILDTILCSSPHPKSASIHAGPHGAQHADPLSLPMHDVLVQILVTTMMQRNKVYAAAIFDAILDLDVELQPGESPFPALRAGVQQCPVHWTLSCPYCCCAASPVCRKHVVPTFEHAQLNPSVLCHTINMGKGVANNIDNNSSIGFGIYRNLLFVMQVQTPVHSSC